VDICVETLESRISDIKNKLPIQHVIIDCSCINNIDSQGVSAFTQVSQFLRFLKTDL
jgi:anti-anti-sigma regulatory factor